MNLELVIFFVSVGMEGVPHNTVFLFHVGDTQPIDFLTIFHKPDQATIEALELISASRSRFCSLLNGGNFDILLQVRGLMLLILWYLVD